MKKVKSRKKRKRLAEEKYKNFLNIKDFSDHYKRRERVVFMSRFMGMKRVEIIKIVVWEI